jgi:hypothetical protein
MGWELHVSLALALCVDESLDDSSVQFLALAAHAQADIPLEILTLAKPLSFVPLASSMGSLVGSIGQCSILM